MWRKNYIQRPSVRFPLILKNVVHIDFQQVFQGAKGTQQDNCHKQVVH